MVVARSKEFREYAEAHWLTKGSARSYVSYLNKFDRLTGGVGAKIEELGTDGIVEWADQLPIKFFGSKKDAGDLRSALRRYAEFLCFDQEQVRNLQWSSGKSPSDDIVARSGPQNLVELLIEIKSLASKYYAATGKPLGVTGEVAELEAAARLNLELAPPRTSGYDATDRKSSVVRRVQIKGRAVDLAKKYIGRCPAIKCGNQFDDVVLVLLDRETLDVIEIWQSDEASVIDRLAMPGSKSRNERKSMGISQFKSIARKVWP